MSTRQTPGNNEEHIFFPQPLIREYCRVLSRNRPWFFASTSRNTLLGRAGLSVLPLLVLNFANQWVPIANWITFTWMESLADPSQHEVYVSWELLEYLAR